MTARETLIVNYPNSGNNQLPWCLGCAPEEEIDNAKNFFLRWCFKDVTIKDVIPLKQNIQPSCVWQVYYKLKDPTPDYVEPGKCGKDFPLPLPDNDDELKKLFTNITEMVFGMNAAHKTYTFDKVYAIVGYVPKYCVCPVQNFNEPAKLPRMQESITEVSRNLYGMKL
ncbi:hypothetical protein Zmor_011591 [Zophobas morio]|uniref:Uncharacterized protein n=1 Tax=Zophobas morio TaxID=2755281 RepID=A0AA38IRP2_9CUCU|nr:hypothetical protein Zmor_011591 [Zophobas morio]